MTVANKVASGCGLAALPSLLVGLIACSPIASQAQPGAGDVPDSRPNILLIVADDLGYSDLGIFGSEIPTPNIDRLAADGTLLTHFHASLACSPSRAMLMSGVDHHRAGLGVMGVPGNALQRGQPGYEGYLNFRVASVAELLGDAGYQTFMVGKWHLGRDDETLPPARGFDRSFISLDGASHLGGLSWGGPGLAPYVDEGERVTVGDDFYSTRFYTERMQRYIDNGRANGRPFFAYVAYTAPHWPLQAPAESLARFEGWYDDGYDAIYARRLERLKASGLAQAIQQPAPHPVLEPRWNELSADERRREARYMEIYAAMVSDLDRYIGELIEYLESIGEMENTVLIFMSDNGPEPRRASIYQNWVDQCCDNSFDNLGKGDSYVMYGANWARVSAAPFNRAKSTAFEGGTRVPAFVRYPQRITAGVRDDRFATMVDILPTLLEIAGHEHPGARYRGRDLLPLAGRSLWPRLTGRVSVSAVPEPVFGWELYGHRAVAAGRWKIVWDQALGDAASWQLFDLVTDPGEQTDLAREHPDRRARMLALWDDYAERNGVILVD